MSEKYADNNVKQTSMSLGQVSTMGNLFSKEDPEGQDSQKEALPEEETRSNQQCSPPTPLLTDQEHFFKFFDKATTQEPLLSEANEPQVLDSEKVILNAFLNEVRNAKPAPLKNWAALQHYVYFIYRHVISEKPCNSNEIFPNIITKKIRDLVESLLQEDVVQLCIRLVTLVREYGIIARGHFDNLQHPKITVYLISLMSYYSAFCSAASKLSPLIPEFDFIIMEKFNVNWLCLNKSIFYHYVYMSPAVQVKIPIFHKLKEGNKSVHKNLLESYSCFCEDMSLIAARWANLRMRISNLSRKRALSDPGKQLLNDWKMFEEHKRILKTNYWMVRNTQAMQVQDMTALDVHLLSLVGDTAYISDFLINSEGHCLCEDCLAAEFRSSSMTAVIPSPFQAQSSAMCRLITCYICQDPIALDALASHIVTKHHDNPPQKGTRVYLTAHQKRFPKKSSKSGDSGKTREPFPFEGLFEKNLELKESILKLVNGRVPRNNVVATDNKDGQDTSFKTEEGSNFRADLKDPSFQPTKKLSAEPVFNSTEPEELKHKPASTSRAAESCFPLKSSPSPIFQTPNESSLKTTTKEPVFKIASEAPVMQNGSEIMFKGASKSNEEMQSCKAAFDEFLKQRNETGDSSKTVLSDSLKWKSTDVANKKATEVLMKSAELFSNKDVPKNVGEKTSGEVLGKKPNFIALASANTYVNTTATENIAFRKPQQKGMSNLDQKMLEFLKNANTQKSTTGAATKPIDNTCSGHACGHKCKQEDDKQAELKKLSCQDTCEHHKESRKCDCAYCEVFGASLPPHTHKTNETRDRLRTRLNQRKEKVNEGVNKGIPKASPLNAKLATKSNGSLNCTIKITGSSKISMLNGKTLNVSATSNAKVNIKPVVNDTDMRVPPRVPEVVHPVPLPATVKPVPTATAPKKLSPTLTNGQISFSGIQKVSGVNVIPLYGTTEEEPENDCAPPRPLSVLSSSISSLNSDNVDSRDINELLNYIEGNKSVDKAALAQKKAAKKARQRIKKAQERERAEKEKRLKEEARIREEKRKEEARIREEKRKEEERLKAELLAKQLAEKQKKSKKNQEEQKQQQKQEIKKNSKKKGKNNSNNSSVREAEKQSNLIEETIPAMVTIKRVAEGSNSPATVTITLKGSTPESDKLLFTLVNGHNNKEQVATATINTDNKVTKSKADSTSKIRPQQPTTSKIDGDNQKNSKKKKKKGNTEVASKELKVTIAVDKNNVSKKPVTNKKNTNPKVPTETKIAKNGRENENKTPPVKFANNIRDDINLPMLRLPPGITITKIEGPPAYRNCKASSSGSASQNTQNPNVPVSKSGVIVVDTEKLIQQSITASNNKKIKKKNKKKRDQKLGNTEGDGSFVDKSSNGSGSSMVTLKNPIFHTLQTALSNKVADNADLPVFPNNQQASIFKNENGMVTIRSPRLQNSYENGSSISSFLSDLKPMFGPEVSTPYVPMCHTNFSEGSKNSPFNAQEILSGLPGIEITKVDKTVSKTEPENKKASQPAEVSIIPTNNGAYGADKFNFDRDDWPFESVFTPRDVLEEDMDAEERELEAFKRFCQQSIPPERKEKVAHLNVKDIILTKKRDVTYS